MRFRLAATMLCALLLAAPASADEVLLTNGNILRGRILYEDDAKIELEIPLDGEAPDNTVTMTLEKSRVRQITRSPSVFETSRREAIGIAEEETPEPAAAEEPPPPSGGSGAEGGAPQTPETDAGGESGAAADEEPTEAEEQGYVEETIDPALERQVESLLRTLGESTREGRDAAENQLVAIGEVATPTLGRALLTSDSNRQKISIVQVLGRIGDRRAVRALLTQLRGGRDDKTRMRHAWTALKRITGQDIYFNEDHGEAKRESDIRDWLDWWESAKEDYPEQVGGE